MSSLTLSDAWADPDGYNSGYNYFMDKRETMIKSFLTSPDEKQRKYGLHLIRSGIKEEVEMYGISSGGKALLEDT